MTVLQAIQANPVLAYLSGEQIQFALDSRSIDGAASFEQSSLKDVELASADLYTSMALIASFKEGQLGINFDPALIKKRALEIYIKYDDERASELLPKPINVGVTAVDV